MKRNMMKVVPKLTTSEKQALWYWLWQDHLISDPVSDMLDIGRLIMFDREVILKVLEKRKSWEWVYVDIISQKVRNTS